MMTDNTAEIHPEYERRSDEPKAPDDPLETKQPTTQSVPETKRIPLIRVDRKYNRKSGQYDYALTSKPLKKISGKYALVVRKDFNFDRQHVKTTVEIRGLALRDVLATTFQGAEGLRLNEEPPCIHPHTLCHAAADLRTRLREEQNKAPRYDALIFDIQAALQFIEEDYSDAKTNVASLLSEGEITFETIWAIFPPNELVFTLDHLSEPQVFRAVDCRTVEKRDCSIVFHIDGRYVDWDGKRLGWAETKSWEIPQFSGAKRITDLRAFPLRFHADSDLRVQLVDRGRRRMLLSKQSFFCYTGHGLREKKADDGKILYEKFNSHGRIVIDHATFKKFDDGNTLVPVIDHAIFEDLTDDELVTIPSMLYGFSFGDKVWGGFAVSRIEEVEWDDSIWESLVIPTTQKQYVRSLVKNHVSEARSFDDFVCDKGKGLICLLTGPPGVGKTLTAEAVAEVVRRPLYVLSSGELGDRPDEIDKRLRQVIELAQTWNAVLLLDEADVFMTKRDDTDILRNAIVSIFLRQLEYYQGILILTTNRANTIDEAFQSRIHLRFNYPNLSHAARRSIWEQFVRRAAAHPHLVLDLDTAVVEELAHMELNGRQIRNTIKLAIQVAVEEGKQLTSDGIKLAAELTEGCSSGNPLPSQAPSTVQRGSAIGGIAHTLLKGPPNVLSNLSGHLGRLLKALGLSDNF